MMGEDAWLEAAYEDRCSGYVGHSEDEEADGEYEPHMAAVRSLTANPGWDVVDEDGEVIAGPFRTLALAERWMETH